MTLFSAIAVANLVIILADSDSRIIYSSWMLIINSSIAAGLSLIALIKDRSNIKKDKTAIHLTIGLVFWFIANIIWGYYEIILDIVSPVPSLADLFLLSAYGFLIYRLLVTYKQLGKITNKKTIYFVSIGTGLFLIYILNLMLSLTEISNSRGLMLFIVTIAYPILNSILTVLALTILLNIKNERHHFIPWVCELVGLLAIVIGDSWFAIIVLTAFVEQIWISAILLSAHYLLIAGGLVWYLRHYSTWDLRTSDNVVTKKIRKIFSIKIILLFLIPSAFVLILLYLPINSVLLANQAGISWIYPTFHKPPQSNSIYQEHIVGAIIPLSGSLSSIGKPVLASLEKAEGDVNGYFEYHNMSSRVKLMVADSKTSPEESLAAIKYLYSFGARVIVGPATSTAVSAVLDFANENNITLLSYASTSPKLSIGGDSLFRLVPDDKSQGKVMAEKMMDDGIKVIVPFWRADIYGNELVNATKSYFEKLGGKTEEGVNYKPHTGKFATSLHRINFIMWNQELKKMNTMVSDAITKYGKESVGVYVISYDEITPILIQAQLFDNLGKVSWYGSDGIAENHHLTKNIDSANFATQTGFTNPLYSVGMDNQTSHVMDGTSSGDTDGEHDGSMTYTATAYDSFWIASKSLVTNSTMDRNQADVSGEGFNEILVEIAESYDGITGKIDLNLAGDRISENYDFWYVVKDNITDVFNWEAEPKYLGSNH
ncbi:MAG: penicillin-binding protein activator [Candidatus Nitrosocosmicus sp.]|nr:penicillin-binding protein activator [Candidatus Nitrosocosmicus sp.]MDN5867425.1 penicillin-binding protein activator [Candidatus Nitrosocosmicus sp.]